VVLLLNTKHRIRGHHLVSIGSLNETVAHPREVFRAAVIGAAYGVVLMHNHPSGEPRPSEADKQMTRLLANAGQMLRIPVLDHVIIGSPDYFSFREAGIL
jgi:DNA repair protein RadC